jgi:cobalt-zinc-cadmium resistance protein CzcA
VISRFYGPVLLFALRRKSWVLAGAALLLCVAVVITRLLGLEFLPKLEEGNLWIRATLPSTISLEEGNNYVNQMRTIIGNFPEVESVVSQHGRPDDGTDATGFFNAEFFAPLKPALAWPEGMSKDQLTNEMLAKLQDEFLGVEFNFSQYLQDNVSEAVSGVKGENSIKLFGDDLEALTKTAHQIKGALAGVRGITDLAVFTSLGQPTVQIDIDRARAGRYGLTPGDINSTVRSAIGGDSAGELYVPNSDQHFPIIVRLAPRCGLHLPRAATALPSHQIQRTRSRSRQCDCGGAEKNCSASCATGWLPSGMGGGIRQSSGGNRQAQNSRPDNARTHCIAAVDQFRVAD